MSTIETMSQEAITDRGLGYSILKMAAKAIWERFGARRDLRRTRLRLFELSDAELADIGLTRDIADREASRSLLACYLNNSR